MLVRRTKRLLRTLGVLPRPAIPTPAAVPDGPAAPAMSADGRYIVDETLKARMHAAGIDSAPPPGGMYLPVDSVFEPPCGIQWMSVYGRVALGSFSYAVSGFFNDVTIGRYVSIGEEVQIGRGDHSIRWLSTSPTFYLQSRVFGVGRGFEGAERYHAYAPDMSGREGFVQGRTTVIENDVWIGHRAYIRPGVTIHTGAIVGACAVVTRDVPPYAVVAGNPARVVRHRFEPPLVERLLASRWWTLAPWQLDGVDVSRPETAIDALEARVAAQSPYAPTLVRLTDLV